MKRYITWFLVISCLLGLTFFPIKATEGNFVLYEKQASEVLMIPDEKQEPTSSFWLKVMQFDIVHYLSGWKFFTVLTESMEPAIRRGTLLAIHQTAPEDIVVGDIISFFTDSSILTHRVTEIDEEKETFKTQGDANPEPDKDLIPFENLIGKVEFKFEKIGKALLWTQDFFGKFSIFNDNNW